MAKFIIKSKEPRDRNHLYAMFNIEAMKTAASNLKESSFKLWIYLDSQKDGFTPYISDKSVTPYGVSESSFYTAKKELIEKGYLKQNGEDYEFYEMPTVNIDSVIVETAHNAAEQQAKLDSIVEETKYGSRIIPYKEETKKRQLF